MPSQSHGRIWLVGVVCLFLVLLVLKYQFIPSPRDGYSFTRQYIHSKQTLQDGIANDTLGFEKIFAINAPWRTDRKDSISLAASYSGISLDWIDGVRAEDILLKAYPPGNHQDMSEGNRGSWRAHMNAIREVIQQNLTTALIFEDDVDWDFRIRSQLSDFSHAARKLQDILSQSEHDSSKPPPSSEALSQNEQAKLSTLLLPPISKLSTSHQEPYGLDWDILWLGHCGAKLPPSSPNSPNRIMLSDDPTVPEPQYLKPMSYAPLDAIGTLYSPHSRLVHRANETLCTIAYAVTQSGARKILYEFGVREMTKGYDFALSDYCNGLTRGATKETMPMCVTVQPPIFSHHFAEKGGSDIMKVGQGGKVPEGTRYVKWSVRMNLERLVKGEEGIVEQWPDTVDR
ncbi:glycosyltransferase family 25 protein [Aaosphaeria arxii CBS 175.79]|uniref:Glycosyltransferase family 25 protein n=1 Tax=Aaosphaeria arxii CBS 175.79 TaxID=1450172 RepID=A0A6A5Y4W1_9PLEO|nr:glycosyltransferase family 25 protein [Aaosphaeria arxii CBS 175.79]KAF2020548.1 glycosyltransferase family 25 protein [Aaosphaeria arxii CBS 175.79]